MEQTHEGQTARAARLQLCACYQLRAAARNLTDLYNAEMQAVGLRLTQFATLVTLADGEGLPMAKLAEELGLDASTLTRTIKPLLDAGWVQRLRAGDRRTRAVGLTPEGRAKLGEAEAHWARVQGRLRDRLGADRFRELRADLASIAGLREI